MGESSFWYRPTRVVPDQRPLNGRCCCCCQLRGPYASLKLRGSFYSGILSALYQLNYTPDPKTFLSCKNVFEVLYCHAKRAGARILHAAGGAKMLCLFVTSSIACNAGNGI